MVEHLQELTAEIAKLCLWANTSSTPLEARSGEWASGYEGWASLYAAFDVFIASSPCEQWSTATTDLIVYGIARDSDNNHLAKSLSKQPGDLFCLAERIISSPERDARWQIVAALGQLQTERARAETLLQKFVTDEDEYVRRCALLALAEIGSSSIDSYIEPAWINGSEFQRVDILYILWKMGSPQLNTYLSLAQADSRRYLSDYAARILAGVPL